MNVLVACEFSGIVRDAFTERGHNAVSVDFLPSETPGLHKVCDVLEYLGDYWHRIDLMIAHPPCTHTSISGARWFPQKRESGEQQKAINFFWRLSEMPIPKICIEHPKSIMSTQYRKPDQIIQPWQFGHPEKKGICLWLKNLPPLEPTNIVDGREPRVHMESPSPDRWKKRSRFYKGVADAMAEQWGV